MTSRTVLLALCLAAAVPSARAGAAASAPPPPEEHGVFPLSWSEDHFDLFPLVWWRDGKSRVLFPVYWWKKDQHTVLFPLWWSNPRRKMLLPLYYQDENTLVAFPLYGEARHVGSFTEWFGPYGRHRGERPEEDADWCVPLYYRDNGGWQTPLFGWNRNDRSYWFLPGYFHRERPDGSFRTSFLWRLYRHECDAKTGRCEMDLFFIPLRR